MVQGSRIGLGVGGDEKGVPETIKSAVGRGVRGGVNAKVGLGVGGGSKAEVGGGVGLRVGLGVGGTSRMHVVGANPELFDFEPLGEPTRPLELFEPLGPFGLLPPA